MLRKCQRQNVTTFAKQQRFLRIRRRLVKGCRASGASRVPALLMFVWTVFGTTARGWSVASMALIQTRSGYAPSRATQRLQRDRICGKRTRHCWGAGSAPPRRAETTLNREDACNRCVRRDAPAARDGTRMLPSVWPHARHTCGYQRSNHCPIACGYLSQNLVVTAYARPSS